MSPTIALVLGLVIIAFLFAIGTPMFIAFIAGSIPLFLWYARWTDIAIIQFGIGSVNKYTLVAIPLFILVGNLMSASGAAAALFGVVRAFVGHFRAGLGMSAIGACALFGTMCGSTIATALAVGTIVVPELTRSGYSKSLSAAICGTAGCLGIIIPPSIAMIILGEVTGASVGGLFMAGIIPGIMTTILMCIACYITLRRRPEIKLERSYNWGERGRAILKAVPAFLMPLAILGSIYAGIATPSESAAVGVAVALIIGFTFYRGLTVKKIINASVDTVRATAAIYMIIFGAVIFGRVLGYMKVPQEISLFIGNLGLSKEMFTLVFLALFFLFGMIFDAFALYFLCLPPLLPALNLYGFNMIAFSITFVLVVMVGQVTPPVCITLYSSATSAQAPAGETIKESLPYIIAMTVAMLIVAYFPQLSLILSK